MRMICPEMLLHVCTLVSCCPLKNLKGSCWRDKWSKRRVYKNTTEILKVSPNLMINRFRYRRGL